MQSISVLDIEMISLKRIIFSLKEFMLSLPIIGLSEQAFLKLDRHCNSESKTCSFVYQYFVVKNDLQIKNSKPD